MTEDDERQRELTVDALLWGAALLCSLFATVLFLTA